MGKQLKHLGFAYILIHIDFNLFSIDILPNWLAYLLFLNLLPEIKKYQKDAHLLQNLLYYLTIHFGLYWIFDFIRFTPPFTELFQSIAVVISLYFHFQFLTDIANIAYDCPQYNSILNIRTVELIITTLASLRLNITFSPGWMIILVIALLLHVAWTYATFFDLGETLHKKFSS